jgi:hypothetical protein
VIPYSFEYPYTIAEKRPVLPPKNSIPQRVVAAFAPLNWLTFALHQYMLNA